MKKPVGKKQPEPVFKIDVSNSNLMGGWKSYPEAAPNDFRQFLDHYNRVPVVSTAIDLQVDECLSEGFKLTPVGGTPQTAIDNWARDCHFAKKLRQSILGKLVFGNWFVYKDYDPRFCGGTLPNLQGVPPWMLNPVVQNGSITGYAQVNAPAQPSYSPDQIGFIRGDSIDGSVWGKGLIAAANTEIVFKRAMEEQNFNIDRQYAHPIFLIIPSPELKNISSGDMAAMMRRFDDMVMQEEKTRIVGMPNAVEISILGAERKIPETFIAWEVEHNDTQLFIKLRVPPVMLEKGQNATEATAKVQVATHNRYIKAQQDDIDETYNTDILLDNMGQPFAELEMMEPKEPSWQAGAGMQKEQGKEGQKGEPSQGEKPPVSDWLRVKAFFENYEKVKS